MIWNQEEITLEPRSRGYHLITDEIKKRSEVISQIKTGILHLFIKHTSAGLTVNEDADPAVRRDFETHFKRMVPEDISLYEHTQEGPDDMTSHIKSSLLGSSISLPITNGSLNIGTWQGIYLCEHRNQKRSRTLVLTAYGSPIE